MVVTMWISDSALDIECMGLVEFVVIADGFLGFAD